MALDPNTTKEKAEAMNTWEASQKIDDLKGAQDKVQTNYIHNAPASSLCHYPPRPNQ